MTVIEDLENASATDGDPSALTRADIERLGRERPAAFKNATSEILFVFSIIMSMLMAEYFISGFNLVLPPVAVDLHIPEESLTWPTSVFSLVVSAFVLPFGRLADIWGGYVMFVGGMVWFLIWSLVAGFSTNWHMLVVSRALAGFGPSAFIPAAMLLMATTYRPGPRKNKIFSLFGAFAPLGFFVGIMVGGVTSEYLTWRYYFWIGSIVLGLVCLAAWWAIPSDRHVERKDVSMDYLGTITIVPALVLIVFALTDVSHTPDGWKTSYILATFIPGVLLLGVFLWLEGWVVSCPLLPFDLFAPKYMGRLAISLFATYGVFGIYLFYASYYIQTIMGLSSIMTAVYFIPTAAGGIILALVGGFTLHLIPGRILLIISGLGSVAESLLFALIPDNANYWAFIFPAMLFNTIGVDIAYNVSNIFITTHVPAHRQGVAGAVIHSLLFLGISFFLSMADLAVGETRRAGDDHPEKVAFWLATGVGGVALVVFTMIDPGKATSK